MPVLRSLQGLISLRRLAAGAENNLNGSAFPELALNIQFCAVKVAHVLDYGKPQTRAARLFGTAFIHAVKSVRIPWEGVLPEYLYPYRKR